MSEQFIDLDELYPNGRGDGRKFRAIYWNNDEWFEPIYRDQDGLWRGLNMNGTDCLNHAQNNWLEFIPPKKKITKWLWATKDGEISTIFSTEPIRCLWRRNVIADIKIEWTAQKFDEE